MKKDLSRSGRKRFWENHLTQCNATGLSQVEYCRLNKISIKSFQYWKRKFKDRSLPALIEVPLEKSLPTLLSPSYPPLCLVIGHHYRVEIGKGFDSEDFERVLRVLERI